MGNTFPSHIHLHFRELLCDRSRHRYRKKQPKKKKSKIIAHKFVDYEFDYFDKEANNYIKKLTVIWESNPYINYLPHQACYLLNTYCHTVCVEDGEQ
jgi:hypothetical protein